MQPACARCGCSRRWDDDGERVCWCDACHDAGCVGCDADAGECEVADADFQSRFAAEHPDGCIACGCSAEWDAEGERVCWCDACAAEGCVYLTASRPMRSRASFASPTTLPRFTSLGMAVEASRREHTVGRQRYLAEAVEQAERQKARQRHAESEAALAAEEEAAALAAEEVVWHKEVDVTEVAMPAEIMPAAREMSAEVAAAA